MGADIYLLEYTVDDELKKEIETYCQDKGYRYYISDSLELISQYDTEAISDDPGPADI